MKEKIFNKEDLIKDIKVEAKALGIPSGAAEDFAKCAAKAVDEKIKKRKVLTKRDLERIISTELKKYNADLAYVYQIRDKII